MNVDEVLAIVEAFFNAIKTLFAKIKEIFSAVSGEEATTEAK